MRPFSLVAIVLALVACGGPLDAQESHVTVAPEQREEATLTLRQYRSLVEAYRAGDRDAPQRVLEWTPKRLAIAQGLIRVGQRLAPGAADPEPPWDVPMLRSAALLHTEAGFLRLRSDATGEPESQLAIASRLLERGAPETDAFASRWYVTVARVLNDRLHLFLAEDLLDAGRKRLPGDTAILCESGALQEGRAAERRLAWVVRTDRGVQFFEPGQMPTGSRVDAFKNERTVRLTRGAQFLRDAVQAGSSDPLCRLRLGRVRSLLGQYDEADAVLHALQQDEDDAVSYLASMFLGAGAERRGTIAEAEPSYRAAIARFPRGQAAYVALSHVLLARARVAEARAALAATVNAESADRRDPWWWYRFEPSAVVDARFEALRKEALR